MSIVFFQNINAFSVLGLVVPPLVIKPLGSLLRAFSLLLFSQLILVILTTITFFFFSRVYEKMNFDLGFNLFIEVILLLSTIMELNPIKWFSILHFMFDLWIYEYIFLGIIIQSELLFFFFYLIVIYKFLFLL